MLRPSAGHSSFILCALFFLSVVPLCLPDLSSAGRSKSKANLRAQLGSPKAGLPDYVRTFELPKPWKFALTAPFQTAPNPDARVIAAPFLLC